MKTHFVPFLACNSKKMTAFTNMKQIFYGKIRYLFLTYQTFVMVFCLIFSKYFFENMGFLYMPSIQWPMEAYSNGSKRYVYDTDIKSPALTLSFPQAFKDAATISSTPNTMIYPSHTLGSP